MHPIFSLISTLGITNDGAGAPILTVLLHQCPLGLIPILLRSDLWPDARPFITPPAHRRYTTNLKRTTRKLPLFSDGEERTGTVKVPVRSLHFGAVDAYVPSVAFIVESKITSPVSQFTTGTGIVLATRKYVVLVFIGVLSSQEHVGVLH